MTTDKLADEAREIAERIRAWHAPAHDAAAEMIRSYGLRCAEQMRERAAKICDEWADEARRLRDQLPSIPSSEEDSRLSISRTSWLNTARNLGFAIRSLKTEGDETP